jgi:hypothetical protein
MPCSIMDVEVQSFTVKLTTASDALRDEESHWERAYCATDECGFWAQLCRISCSNCGMAPPVACDR